MRRLATVLSLVLLAIVGFIAAGSAYFFNFSPDRDRYPLRGIDVSHHQGEIDWSRVAADDVAFAYIKASEGGDHIDTDFATNFAAAQKAGLRVGAYHFFTLCRPGAEQAANFLAQLPRDAAMLPPAVDLEFEGNCSARPEREAVAAEIAAFLGPIEAALKQQAIFYISGDFYPTYAAALPPRELWTRWIAWHPGNDNWRIWQYHDRGRVDGIEGDVDLNVWQGPLADLNGHVAAR